jgi:membrane protease YdiL (CAAX protease family)
MALRQVVEDSWGTPTSGAFWTAIILVALLFGLGHLPATSAMTPITQVLVVRALVLNGIAGIAFGYLYWEARPGGSDVRTHECSFGNADSGRDAA